MKILQTIPNISEGRDRSILEKLKELILGCKSIKMIEFMPDKDHNRTVISIIGSPTKVIETTLQLSLYAIEKIDMTKHKGGHPRMGAVDVVPFAPIYNVDQVEAIVYSHEFGKMLAQEAGIPVYYYEDSALHEWRKSLPVIRKGEYEALKDKLKDPQWKPDAGEAVFVAKSGATIVGARFPVIAFNVNLASNDLEVAKEIAKNVRLSNGGFKNVKAIGLALEEKSMIQVSMNLTDYRETPIHRVLETIRAEAKRYGLLIKETELVGTIPTNAMMESMAYYLQLQSFESDQVIENHIIDLIHTNED